MTEREALEYVYSQVAKDVDTLYQYYRKRKDLEDEKDTETQIDILVAKKYISISYATDIMFIADYYKHNMMSQYLTSLSSYKNRIRMFLER